jgi:PAS domain S-box-containing protein
MKTAVIEQFGSFSKSEHVSQSELIRRITQLEQENVECKLAARQRVRKCEAQYQAMLESVDAYMTLVDKNLVILWANEKAKKIFGRDIVGKSCCEGLYGKKELCCNPSTCLTRQAFHNGSTNKRHSMKMTDKNGNGMYFEGTARVVSWDNNGTPSVVVKIYKDITGRKLAEEELRLNMKQMRKNLDGTIQAIARTVETRDAYTAGHQRRTTDIAGAVAYEMGLSKQVIDGIRMAGAIHDLGKISVPAEILSKPGQINESEFSLIKQHPQAGFDILEGIDFKWPVADIVLQHHERLNGSGYPYGLKGEEILLEARIIGVADVIEAMASHRPYRPALGIDDAFEEITMNRGVLYDPDVVDASIDLFTKRGYQLH